MTAGIRTVTDRRRYEVIYGKQDFKTLERGQENCYLMTNGLGGFSSMTMTGSVTRNDHAFLMACTQAPNHRYNMVHRLKELTSSPARNLPMAQGKKASGICPPLPMKTRLYGNSL